MESVGSPLAITKTWTRHILTADDPWIFSVTSEGEDVLVRYDDGTPVATEGGNVLSYQDGMSSKVHPLGNIWFKSLTGKGTIELAK